MPMSPRSMAPVVALGLIVLAGCGGDGDDPRPSPSPPPSSPTATTPVVPTMPPEAQQDTRKGAIAFVKHYIALLNYAQATGDVDEVISLSTDTCRDCKAITTRLAELYQDGGRITGGDLVVEKVDAGRNAAEEGWSLLVLVTSGEQVVYEGQDAAPKTLPGGRRSMDFFVVRDGSSWKVKQWSRA